MLGKVAVGDKTVKNWRCGNELGDECSKMIAVPSRKCYTMELKIISYCV